MTSSLSRPGAALLLCAFLLQPACSGHKAEPIHNPLIVPVSQLNEPLFQPVSAEDTAGVVVEGEPAGTEGASPYLLDVEDLLDISIYGEEDLQHIEVAVRPDGRISFAFIGDVQAAGRSVEDVRQEMTKSLARYLRTPQVTVIAKEFAQKKVYVGGEVRTPGIVYLKGREGTLLDALYKTGLVTERASLENAYIMRGNQVVAADFKALVRGDHARNIRLMNEDTIYVPENVERYIYLLGEFKTNMAVETREPIPIVQAIARAGGLAQFAAKDRIIIVRGGLKNPMVATMDMKALLEGDLTQNILVKPGDIIWVGLSGRGKFNEVIQQILLAIAPIVQGTIITNTY
jgi:polysaccharide export outer membrane protein